MIVADFGPEKILGGYRLGPVLGRGAMGVVYRGVAESSGLEVAVKTLRPDLLASGERDAVLGRFLHEAEVSRSLEHENIVRVMDSGRDGEDVFMAMELVLGRELKDILDGSACLPPEKVAELMERLLGALSYSHKKGVIHRDIKPANILLADGGGLKVMDFGIARVESSEMTRAGAMLGTPAYMSPEQVVGERVDRRTDVYSAGVVLYQLLTGRKPFVGSLTQVMQQVLSTAPAAPSSVNARLSRAFDSVVARALAKEREGRFPSTGEFALALAGAFDADRRERESEDATMIMDVAATIVDGETILCSGEDAGPGPDVVAALGSRVRDLLQHGLDNEFSDKAVRDLRALMQEYADTASAACNGSLPPSEPRMAAILERDLSAFTDTALPRLKELIVSGAPLPGKLPSLDDRMDWMGLIDVFAALGKTLETLGRPGPGAALGARVRGELLSSAMLYAGQISTLLFSPDHLELNRVSADFMRLDILQWGLDILGGEAEKAQIANQVRMFSGQVLKRVSATIKEFTKSGDALARFDVASLLYYTEELIVIAERTMEAGESGGYQQTLARDILLEFVDAAVELVGISAGELEGEARNPSSSIGAFAGKLKQLAGLFLFSVRLDDEACRDRLKDLAEAVHGAASSLTDIVVRAMAEEDADESGLRQAQLTALWETAESLGWAGLSERLLEHVRDGMLLERRPS